MSFLIFVAVGLVALAVFVVQGYLGDKMRRGDGPSWRKPDKK